MIIETFKTPILSLNLKDSFNLKTKIKNIRKKKGRVASNLGGYQSKDLEKNSAVFLPLLKTIEDKTNYLARQIGIKNNLKIDNVDQFIFHQANAFMLNFMRKRLKISESKFYIDLAFTGNTVSCTIPIALKEYSKKIKFSEKIMLVGFGVGLSWSGGFISINKSL